MIYQDRNKFIAAMRASRKFRMVFYNFCYDFWYQCCCWTETNMLATSLSLRFICFCTEEV